MVEQRYSVANFRMPDERALTLHQIGQARGDLYAISEDHKIIMDQLTPLPTRAWISRTLLWATAPTWLLLGAVVLLLLR
jgi:hypothetical protein